jgi:hypothetical protein
MKCDDFLPDLETGGFWRRRQARRHAALCPRCAKVFATWLAVKQTLARPELLSPRDREIWLRAAREPLVEPVRRVRLAPVVACLATAACLLIVFVGPGIWGKRDHSETVVPGGSVDVTIVSATMVITLDPVDELTQLAEAADQLDQELRSLRLTAQRLEAQREVLVALNQYGKW